VPPIRGPLLGPGEGPGSNKARRSRRTLTFGPVLGDELRLLLTLGLALAFALLPVGTYLYLHESYPVRYISYTVRYGGPTGGSQNGRPTGGFQSAELS
jgi:hypothetical protein